MNDFLENGNGGQFFAPTPLDPLKPHTGKWKTQRSVFTPRLKSSVHRCNAAAVRHVTTVTYGPAPRHIRHFLSIYCYFEVVPSRERGRVSRVNQENLLDLSEVKVHLFNVTVAILTWFGIETRMHLYNFRNNITVL